MLATDDIYELLILIDVDLKHQFDNAYNLNDVQQLRGVQRKLLDMRNYNNNNYIIINAIKKIDDFIFEEYEYNYYK